MEKIIHPLQKRSHSGEVVIPGSKSHTVRALLIALMAKGESRIESPLISEDTLSCINTCRAMGAEITQKKDLWIVKGTGGKLPGKSININVGNSGTTLYLAAAVAATGNIPVTFDGDEQIRARSADKLLAALQELGASVISEPGGCAPFTVQGPLKGGTVTMECPTSQYLSALLLAAPLSGKEFNLNIPLLYEKPYVEMTLRWLKEQNISIEYSEDLSNFHILPGAGYSPFSKSIPADFSSATFFACAAAMTGSSLLLKGLDMNDSQGDKAVLYMLEKMGCELEIRDDSVLISGNKLKGIDLDLNSTPDALPAIAVTACFAEGKTVLGNVPQARIKETDRISVMCTELKKMGADIEELPDGLIINGKGKLKGSEVSGHGDHRVIMSLTLAALLAENPTTIDDTTAVNITFPDFFSLLENVFGTL